MAAETRKLTGSDIMDVVMERPYGFTVGGRRFFLRPVTLGKSWLLSRLMIRLGVNERGIKANPYLEALRAATEHGETVCRMIAILTIRDKDRLLDEAFLGARVAFFLKEMSAADKAQLLMLFLTREDITMLRQVTGLDKEAERMHKAVQAKDTSNTFTFGGKTVWGTLLDKACERYGWTLDYVLWGISLVNLQMMLADSVTSVYLTDAEKKKAHLTNTPRLSGDNKHTAAMLKAMGIEVKTRKKDSN